MRNPPGPYPTLWQSTCVWARIAALSFGGPAGQIAVMHRILVEEKRWLGDARFLHALNFCMILPGPEAQQLATYIGWLLHGVRGALIAGILFILPGVVAIMALSWIYALFGTIDLVAGLFFGLKAAVLAIVVQAVVRVGRRALKNTATRAIAAASFAAIFFLGTPFPVIVVLAAGLGWIAAIRGVRSFDGGGGHGPAGKSEISDAETLLGGATASASQTKAAFQAGLAALALWLLPVAALAILAPETVFTDIATYFSKLAVLTFGGAYAVLAWVAQEAVGTYGWLTPGEMLDGLGMAETTPGPLIMVLQFVGFMGALREAGSPNPMLAATLGGLLATWVTFAPCFAWIFLGAPWMERLRTNRTLSASLSAVTASVVGVILNLAIWFAVHLIWSQTILIEWGAISVQVPRLQSINWPAAALTILALLAVFRFKLGIATVLTFSALVGAALYHFTLA